MFLFLNIDKKFEEIGFEKIKEDKYGVVYSRDDEKYRYTQVIHILHKRSGNHIIQSYDRANGTCVGLTYLETKLISKKFKQMKRKYKWGMK